MFRGPHITLFPSERTNIRSVQSLKFTDVLRSLLASCLRERVTLHMGHRKTTYAAKSVWYLLRKSQLFTSWATRAGKLLG